MTFASLDRIQKILVPPCLPSKLLFSGVCCNSVHVLQTKHREIGLRHVCFFFLFQTFRSGGGSDCMKWKRLMKLETLDRRHVPQSECR